MQENEIATIVVDTALKVHRELGPGLFESVYESVIEFELQQKKGLEVKRQIVLPVIWDNNKLEAGFRADLIIEN